MRVAVLSDIHGNAVALEAALADLAARSVDQLVCLGDVAASGPQPHAVLERVRALGCPVVMGNTDAWLLEPTPDEPSSDVVRPFATLDRWCVTQLSDDDRAYLRTFQPTVHLPLGPAGTLLAYHGSPRSFFDRVLPTTPDDELDEMFAGAHATLMAGGHTHLPMVRRYRDALLLNPGSVGLAIDRVVPREPIRNASWAEYAVVEAEPGRLHVELCRAAFDFDTWAETMRASGAPEAEWWIQRRTRAQE